MKKTKETIASIKIILFISLILSLIIVPVVIVNHKEESKESFPKYQSIEITEDTIENSYEDIQSQLESDVYFAKLSTMMEYNSEEYTSKILKELLWYYIFNYEVSNDEYFFSSEPNRGVYCISKNNLIKGFKELFDVDISEKVDYIPGYYQYAFERKNGYCLYFNQVASEYTNDVKVAVEKMSMVGTTVIADVYVYEYYTTNTSEELKYISYLDGYIKNKDYDTCKKIVVNHLKGKVTHKELKFKINSKGKFFKYKILSSKIIEY